MANQKASVENIFSYLADPIFGQGISREKSLSLVKDPYSGKYYGSDSYDSVLSSLKEATGYFTSKLANAQKNRIGTADYKPATTRNIFTGVTSNTQTEASEGLSRLQGFTLKPSDYVQKPQMVESFNAHPDGWNKYFESSYKSPRLAEDNNMLIQQNSQGKSNGSATGNQLNSSDSLKIPRTVGTGVGSSTVSLNPFGTLDAGLNI
jgi:hypothetical protein